MTSVRLGSFGKSADLPARVTRRSVCGGVLALLLGGCLLTPGRAEAIFWQGAPARQVVVFGVEATPGSTQMDPKIAPVVQAQLRRLLPNHGFRMIRIKSDRVMANGTVKCDLGSGFNAAASLIKPLDQDGKIQMRFELMHQDTSEFQTIVATPADQFNFFDKVLPTGNRLLIGVGAR